MKLLFTKMQGCGNDYIYIDGFKTHIPQDKKSELAKTLSDRHFGVGADGLIFINPSKLADFEMEMYNADGSRGEMCGNGIRCVARYVYDTKLTKKTSFDIESFGAVKHIEILLNDGIFSAARVDMGTPILSAKEIPVLSNTDSVINQEIFVKDKNFHMTCISMGNPHAVIFTDPSDIKIYGPYFESHSAFPKRINTEFVEVLDSHHVTMRVYERGTGETLACGTGCCAVAVACVLNHFTKDEITIHVLGGDIQVWWNKENNHVYMTGPAVPVYTGTIELKEDLSL